MNMFAGISILQQGAVDRELCLIMLSVWCSGNLQIRKLSVFSANASVCCVIVWQKRHRRSRHGCLLL